MRGRTSPWLPGLLVWLVLVLTSSLLVTPWVAAGLDFGHSHPDGTPAHVHAVSGILTGAITAAFVALASVAPAAVWTAPRSGTSLPERVLQPGRPIRAPPAPRVASAA